MLRKPWPPIVPRRPWSWFGSGNTLAPATANTEVKHGRRRKENENEDNQGEDTEVGILLVVLRPCAIITLFGTTRNHWVKHCAFMPGQKNVAGILQGGHGIGWCWKGSRGGKQQKGSRTVWYQYSSTSKEKERKEKKKKMDEKNEDESSTELSPWCSSMRANRWPSRGSLGRKARASSIESRCDGCLPNTAWISENR